MRNGFVLLFLLLLGVAFAQNGNKIVATVNDDIQVTLAELQAEVNTLPRERLELATTKEGIGQILDQIIQRKLLAQKARALQMDTISIVQNAIERSTESILADFIVINIRQSTTPVTAEEAQQIYTANESLFYSAPSLNLKQIVVATSDDADKVSKALNSGEKFDDLIDKYPGVSGGAQSGSLGVIPLNQLTPNVQGAVQNLKPGEWAGPIQTDAGFHFLEVISRQEPAKIEFEKISEDLVQQLTNQRAQTNVISYVESLVDEAKITIDNAVLKEAIVSQAPALSND
ncbi:hypothetical protein DRQ36_08810 [bacterium]|nr:MAG: hypothetical protein DRQ36_08810 [bacterium]